VSVSAGSRAHARETDERTLAALARIEARQHELLEAFAQLEERLCGGTREAAHMDLLEALYEVLGERPFTAARAISLAEQPQHQVLRDALESCDIGRDDSRVLGWLLRDLEMHPTFGIRVMRVGTERGSVVWQLRVLRVSPEKLAAV
jgi:hypothetical protein